MSNSLHQIGLRNRARFTLGKLIDNANLQRRASSVPRHDAV